MGEVRVTKNSIGGRFATLPQSPFARLRQLLAGLEPGKPEISMAIGEPRHAAPAFVLETLSTPQAMASYGQYPPIPGTPDLRQAIYGWLQRRFKLDAALLDVNEQILPLNGTREGLFLAAQIAQQKPAGLIAMPNPFYQVYAAAAIASGATPIYLPTSQATGFLPALGHLDAQTLSRCQAVYFCSPANPQGAVADRHYLRRLLDAAIEYNFLLLVDECYSEIYDRDWEASPPPSILEVIKPDEIDRAPVLAFHSLSKRSNLPGLRSGFCAGGRHAMLAFAKLRQVAAPQNPLAAQEAAAAAWADDAHVAENRQRYQEKFDLAERVLGNRFGFYRPPGGFFLWLNVGDGEAVTRHLWQTQGVKVLPGAYLARDNDGADSKAYIRVALVGSLDETTEALSRFVEGMDAFERQQGAA